MILIVYLLASLVLMSAVEYISHRWFMHRPFPIVSRIWPGLCANHLTHHAVYGRYLAWAMTREGRELNIDPPYLGVSLLILSPLIALLWWVDERLAWIFMMTLAADSIVWGAMHREMHIPRWPWWRRTAVFAFYERWHEAHHKHVNRNFAVVLPFWDFILGTNYRERFDV